MRILLAIQELRMGGAEQVVAALRTGAQSAGHVVSVAAAPGPLAAGLGGHRFDLPLVERRVTRLPQATRALRRAIRASRPDLVHCHNPAMAVVGSLATGRGRRRRALVTVHGVPEEDYARAARILRLAALPAIACGPGVAAALAEQDFQVRGTIVNGVSPAPPPADRAALEHEWGVQSGSPLVVAVGRLVEQKDQALAIRALEYVPTATLAILGDGPLREQLEREAGRAGVSARVFFAGSQHDARPIIGAADALVLSSRWEGLALVVLEALAAGTPVIATAVRGVRELLTNEQNSLLVPHGDAEALGRAIRRLVEDRSLAAELAREGRLLAATYSEERMVSAYLELYDELAAA